MAEQTNHFDCDINLGFDITVTPRDEEEDHTQDVKYSDHTGLLFPSGRVWSNMGRSIVNDTANNCDTISPSAAVYLSAVLEFITSQVLQLSANASRRRNKARIEPPDIQTALQNDPEFGAFLNQLQDYPEFVETKESKARCSVPASPYDDKQRERLSNRNKSRLRFWAESEDESHETASLASTDYTAAELKLTNHASEEDAVCILNDIQFIPGLYYIEGYITADKEQEIVQFVNNNEWNKVSTRIVQKYGCGMKKKPFHEIPICVKDVLKNIAKDDRLSMASECVVDQLVVDNYPSFGGMEYNRDSTEFFGEYIVIVSLLNEAVIDFRHMQSNEVKQMVLKPKSLLVLSGDARYVWEYGIKESDVHSIGQSICIARKQRMSLTCRKCINLEEFDRQNKGMNEQKRMETENNNMFLFKIDSMLNTMDTFMD